MEKVLALVLVVYVGSAIGYGGLFQSKMKPDAACQQYLFRPYETLKNESSQLDSRTEDTSRKITFNEIKGNQLLLKSWYYRSIGGYREYYYRPIPQKMVPAVASKGSVLSYEGIPSLLVSKDGEVPIEYHMTLFDIAFITNTDNAASPPYVRVTIEFEPKEGVEAPQLYVIFFVYKGVAAEGDQINGPLSSFLTEFNPDKFAPDRESENDFSSDPIPVDFDMMRDALNAATKKGVKIYYEASDPDDWENDVAEGMELREVIVGCQYVSADLEGMYLRTVMEGARSTE